MNAVKFAKCVLKKYLNTASSIVCKFACNNVLELSLTPQSYDHFLPSLRNFTCDFEQSPGIFYGLLLITRWNDVV